MNRTKLTKQMLINVARKSNSIEHMCKLLGRDESDAEKIWDRLMKCAPVAEDFINRNECISLMHEQKVEGDFEALKNTRADFIMTILRLRENKLIYVPPKEEIAQKLFENMDVGAVLY